MTIKKTAMAAAMIAGMAGGLLGMAGPAAAATAAPTGFHDNGHVEGNVVDPSGNPWHGAPGDGAVTPTGHDWSDGIGGDSVDPSGNSWNGSIGGDAVDPDAMTWTCDGDVCLRAVPDGVVVPNSSGCNHQVCVSVGGNAASYGATGQGSDFFGHVDIWGPGLPRHSGPTGSNPTASGTGHGSGSVCAEGWAKQASGGFVSVGLPCVGL